MNSILVRLVFLYDLDVLWSYQQSLQARPSKLYGNENMRGNQMRIDLGVPELGPFNLKKL